MRSCGFKVIKESGSFKEFLKEIKPDKDMPAKEFTLLTKYGVEKIMRTTAQYLYFDDYSIILVTSYDITEKKEMEKRIMNAIIETEEKERGRLAIDLHDGLGPILSAIKLYNHWINNPDTITSKAYLYKKSEETIDEAISTLKEISANLSPHILRNFGLVAAIKSFIEKTSISDSLKIDFTNNIKTKFSDPIETSIYRIFTECVNNSIKYAAATHIEVRLLFEQGKLIFLFRDNGRGFDVERTLNEPKGMGLNNIANRVKTINGKIDLISNEKGTEILVEINI